SLMSGPLLLAICMLAAFVATTVLVMALTTPHVTPAQRLARYARYTGRRGSPGAEAEMLTLRERIIAPLFQKVIELAARAAPSRVRPSWPDCSDLEALAREGGLAEAARRQEMDPAVRGPPAPRRRRTPQPPARLRGGADPVLLDGALHDPPKTKHPTEPL